MRLFAFGSNGSGQLGISNQEDTSTPTQCHFSSGDKSSKTTINEQITTISCGGNHTLLLTNLGTVYASGCNSDGRCGPKDSDSDSDSEPNIFQRVILHETEKESEKEKQTEKFTHIATTWEGSILVSDSGIHVLGSNTRGELGTEGSVIPNFPPAGTRVVSVAGGMAHCLVVLCNGEVWGWGAGRKGQLGKENLGVRIGVKRVLVPFLAEEVVCGREFSVVFGGGRFVVLGDERNRWGVCRVPDSLAGDGVGDPGFVGGFGDVLGIRASWHGVYVHVREEDGAVVAWGRNDRGQIPSRMNVGRLAVGSEHVVALLKDGSVAVCGWGEHGNCGPETDSDGNVCGYKVISLPEDVQGKVVDVGAGCATSWIVVD